MTTSTQTTQSAEKKRPVPSPRNGVDTHALFATLDAVKGQPELAQFQFRASNRWIRGTHSRSRMESFTGAGGEHEHARVFEHDGDHPAVLCGADHGPTPVEYLLHALASCLTAGIGNVAAARGVDLEEVESTVEGDIDLQGLLGLSNEVRNGYQQIRVQFRIKGDAPAEKLREIVERSTSLSAVFDVLTNGVPVAVEVDAA
ncbi:MAG: OsmC family protein [Myxococcota bacterium]